MVFFGWLPILMQILGGVLGEKGNENGQQVGGIMGALGGMFGGGKGGGPQQNMPASPRTGEGIPGGWSGAHGVNLSGGKGTGTWDPAGLAQQTQMASYKAAADMGLPLQADGRTYSHQELLEKIANEGVKQGPMGVQPSGNASVESKNAWTKPNPNSAAALGSLNSGDSVRDPMWLQNMVEKPGGVGSGNVIFMPKELTEKQQILQAAMNLVGGIAKPLLHKKQGGG